MNLYSYVGGDPINKVDPLGHQAEERPMEEITLTEKPWRRYQFSDTFMQDLYFLDLLWDDYEDRLRDELAQNEPEEPREEETQPAQACTNGPSYVDRYVAFVSDNAINVGPYAVALLGGVWPKSLAPATSGRPPLLGSTNPLTSVPRAFGVPGADSALARTGAAGIGLLTVGIGFYNVTIELSGFAYAIPSYGNGSCPE